MKHGRPMSDNAHEELYKLLLDTSEECPMEVLANCVEIMATVINRRLHDLAEKLTDSEDQSSYE